MYSQDLVAVAFAVACDVGVQEPHSAVWVCVRVGEVQRGSALLAGVELDISACEAVVKSARVVLWCFR